MKVRTRMAPSPTGEYHIGHIRTVLYNYALAKQNQGEFIIRIEDTDQTRLVPGALDRILQDIKDYGIKWDEGPKIGGPYGPYIQSQRLEIYQKYAQKLIDKKQAYYCFCTKDTLSEMRTKQKEQGQVPKYDRRCLHLTTEEIEEKLKKHQPHVIRQKLPDNQTIKFNDLVMGEISINTKDLDDTILLKSDGYPTYHLAVVVDDYLMKITHILRGSEWISSTPKHILLYQAFNWTPPQFAHLPVFLNPNGKGKMSKRHGSVSARSFLEQGYLPEALLNFLMLLGWAPSNDKEIFSLKEFVQAFEIRKVNTSNPTFDIQKLKHFNMHYIKKLSNQDLAHKLKNFAPKQATGTQLIKLAPLVKERMKTLSEFTEMTKFIFNDIQTPETGWKEHARNNLNKALEIIKNTQEKHWNTEYLTEQFMSAIEVNQWKTSHFFMNLRLAISGQKITPPITESIVILGQPTAINRIKSAIQKLTDMQTEKTK